MTTTVRGWRRAAGLALALGAWSLSPPGVRAQDEPARATTTREDAAAALKKLRASGYAAPQRGAPELYEALIAGKPADLNTGVGWVAFRDPADRALGATLEPIGESLRAQLGLPGGLTVSSLAGDGPAARAGLRQNDILLSLADKPLAQADDLSRHLKAAGETDVTLKLLRAGKPVTLTVRPVYRVTIGPAGGGKTTDYFIGVSAAPPDGALRAHLNLPDGKGMVVNDVVRGAPAEKAGVKPHDILLEMGGKPLGSTETLVAQVQAARDKPTPLTLLRAGKTITVEVTPEPREAEADAEREAVRLWTLGHQAHPEWYRGSNFAFPTLGRPVPSQAVPQADATGRRLEALDKELKALREAVEELRDTLKTSK